MPDHRPAASAGPAVAAGAPVVAVLRFEVPEAAWSDFAAAGERVVAALAAQRGFRTARLGRSADEPGAWLLVTEWAGPGAWRRALSAFDVRCELTPTLVWAQDAPGAFEVLYERDADGPAYSHGSALAPDAAVIAPGAGVRTGARAGVDDGVWSLDER
ncbi:antibiotic biosynthesis monooxygenase [Parafrankia sp. EUN1f]|uniref:antibiotic biosynthesis monooxygenase family protein n=1 Tax=Parafrankia sp. EUN1f TaxID=102897 RepID=UPI0006813E04|nr:antibiotic biosynthesis monooxygenase family protein [Parafrankia sp. EUN1f]